MAFVQPVCLYALNDRWKESEWAWDDPERRRLRRSSSVVDCSLLQMPSYYSLTNTGTARWY